MKGKACLILSAFIYGIAPSLAQIAYKGGANVMTLTFLRTFLMIPLLFVIMKLSRRSFRITHGQLRSIAILGIIGGTLPNITLYTAYSYIPTGLATTLHFIYPLVIIISSALIYREKIKKTQLGAVMLVTAGIFMFTDFRLRADNVGIILAILSGILYSFYVVYMDYSGISGMDYIKLTFYLMIVMSAGTLLFGVSAGMMSFSDMNAAGWAVSALISLLVTAFALPLFQLGVRYEGASTAGIISAFEPITTLALGSAFLGESMTVSQMLGGALILFGVVFAQRYV